MNLKNEVIITAQQIKELREKTGAGVSDVKKALEESGGDMDKAFKRIEHRFGSIAEKKSGRETKAGLIESYLHSNGRIGAMLELFCETDFVSRSSDFKELAHGLAMHIAAMRPVYLSLETVPKELWLAEKNRLEEETGGLNKPDQLREKIVVGKLKSYFAPISFLEQPFVKNQDKTVGEVIKEAVGKFGENVKIGRFVRFEF